MKIKQEDASEDDDGITRNNMHSNTDPGADFGAREVKPVLLAHIKGRNCKYEQIFLSCTRSASGLVSVT